MGTPSVDLSILETPIELFIFLVIPEPSSGLLLMVGMGVLLFRRQKVKQAI